MLKGALDIFINQHTDNKPVISLHRELAQSLGQISRRMRVMSNVQNRGGMIADNLESSQKAGDETPDSTALEEKAKQRLRDMDSWAELYVEVDRLQKELSKKGVDDELKAVLDATVKVGTNIGR